MGLFGKNADANWVECEKKHGFDLNKNSRGCPLCELTRKNQPLENISTASSNLLSKPSKMKVVEKGAICINENTRTIGTHPWFNTLFSAKAACRILENIRTPNKEPSLQDLLTACKPAFIAASLTQYRGFPKDVEEPSSLGRLALHFLQAYSDLGLIAFKMGDNLIDNLPSRGWDKIKVVLTVAGAEFIALPNKIFDEQQPIQQLTDEERTWFINYVKQAEKRGFGEYRVLKDFAVFLKKKPTKSEELRNWFLAYAPFKQFVAKNPNEDRAKNLAATLAGSKLALLRELGIVNDARNDYSVVRDL